MTNEEKKSCIEFQLDWIGNGKYICLFKKFERTCICVRQQNKTARKPIAILITWYKNSVFCGLFLLSSSSSLSSIVVVIMIETSRNQFVCFSRVVVFLISCSLHASMCAVQCIYLYLRPSFSIWNLMKEAISTNQIKPPHRHRRKRARTFARFGKYIYVSIDNKSKSPQYPPHRCVYAVCIHIHMLPPLNHGKQGDGERVRKRTT